MKRGAIERGTAWALVTGAGSGIGRCYALRLAASGYRLVLVGERAEPLEAVGREIEAAGGAEVRLCPLDLARTTAAQELFDWTRAQAIDIDVLVNNAGIFSFCDVLATPPERIERIILLHDLTATQLCRLFAGEMIRRGVRGHILNMSSYSLWMPFPGLSVYSASKAYLKSFSIAFAREVADRHIRVTAVCPAHGAVCGPCGGVGGASCPIGGTDCSYRSARRCPCGYCVRCGAIRCNSRNSSERMAIPTVDTFRYPDRSPRRGGGCGVGRICIRACGGGHRGMDSG